MLPSSETLKAVLLLKVLRLALQWPQVKMAKELEISQSALARLERFDANVSINILSKIMKLSKSHGIECDIFSDKDFTVTFPDALLEKQWLSSEASQSSDK
jgi:transcriptional regulator with XRE-family HTH domain